MENRIYGVYTITCTINGKILVGEGKVETRLSKHRWSLEHNQHKNPHLQNAYNKYGKEVFKFEVLDYCGAEFTKSFENYWCNLLDTHNNKYGYNKLKTNPVHRGGPSVEMRKKIGDAHRGRKYPHRQGIPLSEETKQKLREKALLREVTKEQKDRLRKLRVGTKLSSEEIEKIRVRSTGKLHTDESKKKMSTIRMGIVFSDSHKKNLADALKNNIKTSRPIVQMDLNGNFIKEYPSLMEAGRQLTMNTGTIHNLVSGRHQSYKGSMFCYKENYEPGKYKRIPHKVDPREVLQYTLEGEFIREWKSLVDAAEFLTSNRRRGPEIGAVCRGEKKRALGYKWKHKIENVWNTKK